MVAHPPCTYLSNSGVRWLYEHEKRWQKMIRGAVFFRKLLNSNISKVAVENPIMHTWAKQVIGEDHDFCIQPYEFGHAEKKKTCFWARNLKPLEPTEIVDDPEAKVHNMSPSEDRNEDRSRFYEGIAEAMANQWG